MQPIQNVRMLLEYCTLSFCLSACLSVCLSPCIYINLSFSPYPSLCLALSHVSLILLFSFFISLSLLLNLMSSYKLLAVLNTAATYHIEKISTKIIIIKNYLHLSGESYVSNIFLHIKKGSIQNQQFIQNQNQNIGT